MKRHRGLYRRIIAADNVWRGWLAFRRGKNTRPSVIDFARHAEAYVAELQRELASGSYQPSPYRTHIISRPKRRLIAAAPVRDRVVHHAVHQVLAPLLDAGLIEHTYACLPGRGTHRAVIQFRRGLQRFRHVLLLDIRHYFLSIDHDILLSLMARKLKEPPLLALLALIAKSGEGLYSDPEIAAALRLPRGFPPPGCGLPIGNLTSQWWGNHYLSGLDHLAKRELKLPHVQRYMDDIACFANDAAQLEDVRQHIIAWLAEERRLRLKHPQAPVRDSRETFNYLGMRVSRDAMSQSAEGQARVGRRLSELALAGTADGVERSLASLAGNVVRWTR